jgi:hypothetical protein
VLIASAHALQDRFPWWGSGSAGHSGAPGAGQSQYHEISDASAEPELAYDSEYKDETYTVQVLR